MASRSPSRSRSAPVLPPEARPCVWMSAGLVSYKLCDRDLECEGCPLDGAFRGVMPDGGPGRAAPRRGTRWAFPEDRRYALAHTWARRLEEGRCAIGIDAFAAALVSTATRVQLGQVGRALRRGEAAGAIDLGGASVWFLAPLGGHVERANPEPAADVAALFADPYGCWLLELRVDPDGAGAEWAALVDAASMRERARLDVRRFGRQIAMQLLTGPAELGRLMSDGGEAVLDVRQMLGVHRYAALVRGLLG